MQMKENKNSLIPKYENNTQLTAWCGLRMWGENKASCYTAYFWLTSCFQDKKQEEHLHDPWTSIPLSLEI